jgi:hypothetical protein
MAAKKKASSTKKKTTKKNKTSSKPKPSINKKKTAKKEIPVWKQNGFKSEEYFIHYRRLLAICDYDEAEKYRPQDVDGINTGIE